MSVSANSTAVTVSGPSSAGNSKLARELNTQLKGEVRFDVFSRGRYATDASIYQMMPLGVVIPRDDDDVAMALSIARDHGVPVTPRGGGTSQCGQTINESLIIDTSKHINNVVEVDTERQIARVQPGIVLDQLNAQLKKHGLFFPVDVSTASRATIGGMTGNNSCGARSIRYGNTVHNINAIDAIMANGDEWRFENVSSSLSELDKSPGLKNLTTRLRTIETEIRDEIEAHWPRVMRNVAGYNLNTINPEGHNLASLLVGSEGTLNYFKEIEVRLAPLPKHKALGVCRFPAFADAMRITQHIVKLDPAAVELVDRNMIDLGGEIEAFKPVLNAIADDDTGAILLVEFAGDEPGPQIEALNQLDTLLNDHGFPGAVLKVPDPGFAQEIWEVRKQGLNIMMSMKGDAKPVSFVEDCAVPLEHLDDYTRELTEVFEQHGTKGTWYAHASVGTLHVRPVLNMKQARGASTMRAIATEAMELVKKYNGAYSGEHGDGIVRSQWIEPLYGRPITQAMEQVKTLFDPDGLFNPGKIVHPPRADDRSLMRFKPGYATDDFETALDWSAWGGLPQATEMCNNNGACRKGSGGVMCPSFRATGNEQDVTRGRANTLRLALSGQLGADAMLSDQMDATMSLCVSCKGCKRECPTGVDMARMKIEYLALRQKRHGVTRRDKLVAYLPRYANKLKKIAPLLNLRDLIPGAAKISEAVTSMSARRSMPKWHRRSFLDGATATDPTQADVALFVDTFNNHFESANARAALKVLAAAGKRVALITAPRDESPYCCGRTFLSAGLVDEARTEASRLSKALRPFIDAGVPIVGLEPSCTLGLRDEICGLVPGSEDLGEHTELIEEYLDREIAAGNIDLKLQPLSNKRALLHGHCHQKAFDVVGPVQRILAMVPELDVELIDSSCCGMAGAFGFEKEHFDISMKMAEQSLLPAVRDADADTLIVADGTSCRHQIHDGAQREAVHVVRVLEQALI